MTLPDRSASGASHSQLGVSSWAARPRRSGLHGALDGDRADVTESRSQGKTVEAGQKKVRQMRRKKQSAGGSLGTRK